MTPSDQLSFLAWLTGTVGSMQTQQLIVYLLVGIIGIFAHYLKGWLNEEVEGSLFKYLFGDHPKKTVITMLSFAGSSIGYIYSGAMIGSGWPALIGLAFTTGYSLDSAFNKGKPPVASEKE